MYFRWPGTAALIFILFYLATNLRTSIFIWCVYEEYNIHAVVQQFSLELSYQRGQVTKPFITKNCCFCQHPLMWAFDLIVVIRGKTQTFRLPQTGSSRPDKHHVTSEHFSTSQTFIDAPGDDEFCERHKLVLCAACLRLELSLQWDLVRESCEKHLV